MFDNATLTDVERNGAPSAGTSTDDRVLPRPGQTAPAPAALDLLRDTTTSVRQLAELDWDGSSPADIDRALGLQRQLDGAVAALRTRLTSAAAGSVVDAAGATDVTNLLRDRLGMSARDARRQATLADGLEGLDATRAALADGRIGADAARQVALAVEDGRLGPAEHAEPALLEQAQRMSPDRLGRWIRRRQADAAPERLEQQERRALAARNIWKHDRPDGSVDWNMRLPHYTSAMLDTALGAYATVDPADTPDELRRSFGQRQADAFHDLLGEALSAPAAGRPGRVRPHVLVVGTAETFRDGTGVADLDGRPISGELARRIGCDAGMSRLLVDARSVPLDLGRQERHWTAGQRRAIVARDGHCRGPSCDRPATWCDIHHIHWWSHGGPTDLDNGLLLCGRHHDLVHHGGWNIDFDPSTARVTWTSRLGTVVTTDPAGVLHQLVGVGRPATGPPTIASETRGRYQPGVDDSAQAMRPASTRGRRRTHLRRAPCRRLVATTGRRSRAP